MRRRGRAAHTDHPRTRGVYRRAAPTGPPGGGSSPHTRGLLDPDQSHAWADRIIPAHAGFTASPTHPSQERRDHPRTRGVYRSPTGTLAWRGGSSPHTRGLPQHDVPAPLAAGIIPAHAGFTSGSGGGQPPREDHPRTRGVYAGRPPVTTCAGGSSPHTRGLPTAGGIAGCRGRIIPAHAGFTAQHGQHRDDHTDHPRTRGVYAAACRPG